MLPASGLRGIYWLKSAKKTWRKINFINVPLVVEVYKSSIRNDLSNQDKKQRQMMSEWKQK